MADTLGAEFARALAARDSSRNWDANDPDSVLSARDGRIDWMRLVCSGYRPASTPE
jgi:hypothetical protein